MLARLGLFRWHLGAVLADDRGVAHGNVIVVIVRAVRRVGGGVPREQFGDAIEGIQLPAVDALLELRLHDRHVGLGDVRSDGIAELSAVFPLGFGTD